jgi:tol-pal system protein YbgF
MDFTSVKRLATVLAFFMCSVPVWANGWGALGGDDKPSEPSVSPAVEVSSEQPLISSVAVQPVMASSNVQADLLEQLEMLQREMMMLRGTLEEQANKIKQLENTTQTRYIDIDSRLSQLVSGAPAAVPTSAAAIEVATTQPITPVQGDDGSDGDTAAYKAAFALVRAQEYQKAGLALEAFQKNYAKSSLIANSWYWLGEVYLIQGKLVEAKEAFTQVVDRFVGHRKEPDARYKLAIVYDRLGDKEKSTAILTHLIELFAESNARVVELAKEYLAGN